MVSLFHFFAYCTVHHFSIINNLPHSNTLRRNLVGAMDNNFRRKHRLDSGNRNQNSDPGRRPISLRFPNPQSLLIEPLGLLQFSQVWTMLPPFDLQKIPWLHKQWIKRAKIWPWCSSYLLILYLTFAKWSFFLRVWICTRFQSAKILTFISLFNGKAVIGLIRIILTKLVNYILLYSLKRLS